MRIMWSLTRQPTLLPVSKCNVSPVILVAPITIKGLYRRKVKIVFEILKSPLTKITNYIMV